MRKLALVLGVVFLTLVAYRFVVADVFEEKPFVPATLINVRVITNVSFEPLPSLGSFKYGYKIISLPDSKQRVWWLDISTGVRKISITGIPKNWIGDDNPPARMIFGWAAVGNLKEANVPFPDGQIPGSIPPGGSLEGFVAKSPALPGIQTAYVRGFAPLPRVRWVDENSPAIPDVLDDAVKIKTVGPDILPDNLSNEQLLDRLISLKEQAFQLGWINHKGVAHSLNKKLQAARKKLLKGEVKTAAHILHAFIHDLEAQHRKEKERDKEEDKEKHVNDHAFYLLKPNAEFILFRLGALEKGKGKEE